MAKKTTQSKKPAETPNAMPARVPNQQPANDAAKCWLEKTNPLVGLSIRTAQAIFDAARAGDTQRLHWLFQEIEAVNPALFTCIERRESAVANFQWSVTSRPESSPLIASMSASFIFLPSFVCEAFSFWKA